MSGGGSSQPGAGAPLVGRDKDIEFIRSFVNQAAIRDSQPGEPGTDKMARLVLRAALEQRRTQQAIEHAGFPAGSASQISPPKSAAAGRALRSTAGFRQRPGRAPG